VHRNLLWNKSNEWKKERQQGEPIAHPNKLFKQRNKTHETQCIKAKTHTSKNVMKLQTKWKPKSKPTCSKQEKDNHIRKRNKDSLTCKVSITKLIHKKKKKTYKESTMRGWQKGGKRLSEEENKRSTMKYLFVVVSIREPKETQMVIRWS
jgi:hypothetical protein